MDWLQGTIIPEKSFNAGCNEIAEEALFQQ